MLASFLGATSQIGYTSWPFLLQILKFLWTAKSISICPSAFHFPKSLCISCDPVVSCPLALQIYDFKYSTVILVGQG